VQGDVGGCWQHGEPVNSQAVGEPSQAWALCQPHAFKKQIVKIIRIEGTDEEGVTEVWAHIQAASGFIDLDTPISRATSLKWRIRAAGR
jgi:hypothetical protein